MIYRVTGTFELDHECDCEWCTKSPAQCEVRMDTKALVSLIKTGIAPHDLTARQAGEVARRTCIYERDVAPPTLAIVERIIQEILDTPDPVPVPDQDLARDG